MTNKSPFFRNTTYFTKTKRTGYQSCSWLSVGDCLAIQSLGWKFLKLSPQEWSFLFSRIFKLTWSTVYCGRLAYLRKECWSREKEITCLSRVYHASFFGVNDVFTLANTVWFVRTIVYWLGRLIQNFIAAVIFHETGFSCKGRIQVTN